MDWLEWIRRLNNSGQDIVSDERSGAPVKGRFWHRANIHLNCGDVIPGWVLKDHNENGKVLDLILAFHGHTWTPKAWLPTREQAPDLYRAVFPCKAAVIGQPATASPAPQNMQQPPRQTPAWQPQGGLA